MISLIVAISKNNCIGKDGQLPWHIPEDLKYFKKVTTGKVVLMGRKTWESIPDRFRPLPNRKNLVITRQADYPLPDGVGRHQTIEEALAAYSDEEIMVIGGGEIFNQTFSKADTLYVTHVGQHVDGGTFFPEIDPDVWKEVWREDHEGFSFATYKKVQSS